MVAAGDNRDGETAPTCRAWVPSSANTTSGAEGADDLDACLEEAGQDAGFLAHALGVVARSRSMSQLARDTGLTRAGLYKALSEAGNPSFGTVLKVVGALGYRISLVREDRAPYKAAPPRRRAKRETGAT